MDRTPLVILVLVWAALAAAPAHAIAQADDGWIVKRVGGDRTVETELKVDRYRSGDSMVEESLPVGYPAPTPPGAIELKRYPPVRRAEFTGTGDPDRGMGQGFFPLFQHITQRDISMTSPVEFDYTGGTDDQGEWTMSFLYRTPEVGPLETLENVRVVDTEPRIYLSAGLSGRYGSSTVDRGLERLHDWLASQDEWKVDGDVRALFYNGPYVPDERKWAEVQIPVRRASAGSSEDAVQTRDMRARPGSDMTPAQLIELAVHRGAPLFNDGESEACASIYEVTASSLLLIESAGLDRRAKQTLREALDRAGSQDDPRERAWTLRHALDDVYGRLAGDKH